MNQKLIPKSKQTEKSHKKSNDKKVEEIETKETGEDKYRDKVKRWGNMTRLNWQYLDRPNHRNAVVSAVESNEKLMKDIYLDKVGLDKFEKELENMNILSEFHDYDGQKDGGRMSSIADDIVEESMKLKRSLQSRFKKQLFVDEIKSASTDIPNIPSSSIGRNLERNDSHKDLPMDISISDNNNNNTNTSNDNHTNQTEVLVKEYSKYNRLNLLRRHNELKRLQKSNSSSFSNEVTKYATCLSSIEAKYDENNSYTHPISNPINIHEPLNSKQGDMNIQETGVRCFDREEILESKRKNEWDQTIKSSMLNRSKSQNSYSSSTTAVQVQEFERRQNAWLSQKEQKLSSLQRESLERKQNEFVVGKPDLSITKVSWVNAKDEHERNLMKHKEAEIQKEIIKEQKKTRPSSSSKIKSLMTSRLEESMKLDYHLKSKLSSHRYHNHKNKHYQQQQPHQECKQQEKQVVRSTSSSNLIQDEEDNEEDEIMVKVNEEIPSLSPLDEKQLQDRKESMHTSTPFDECKTFFDISSTKERGKHIVNDPRRFDTNSLFRQQDILESAVTILYGKRRGETKVDVIMLLFDRLIFTETEAQIWWESNNIRICS